MKTSTRQSTARSQAHPTRATFGALLFLITLALVAALAGSDITGSAQARPAIPNANSSAGAASKSMPTSEGEIAFGCLLNATSVTHICTEDANGGNLTQLTGATRGDDQPAWSYDGSKIAFNSYRDGHPDIWVMNSDGSDQHVLYSGTGQYPTWSPDGSKIAFTGVSGGHSNILVMNSDGSGVRALTNDSAVTWHSSWSPDGTKIAYGSSRASNYYAIYVMNADGGNQHMITNPNGVHDDFPAWSPDSRKIAFVRGLGQNPPFAVYTMNADGSGQTQISAPAALHETDSHPTWSPDGLRLAYARTNWDANTITLHTINANGTGDQTIPSSHQLEQNPDWRHNPTTTVLVQNEQGTPIPGAQVYTNTQGVGFPATLVGTTDLSGTLSLSSPMQNEYIIARSLVYTGTTSKPAHDEWAYHVYLTNINEENSVDGSQSAYVITDTSQLTQTVTISRTNPLIGFNIVASVEYNATPENLSQIATGFAGSNTPDGFRLTPGANDFLLDVTDGQMFLEKVTLYEDGAAWGSADYQFFAYYPRADAGCNPCGPSSLTTICCSIHAQGSGHYGIPWNQTDGYSVLIHEFGHYAIGADDEYYYRYDGDTTTCSLSPDPDYDKRDSIMADQSTTSEFCTQNDHNSQTNQGLLLGESVWDTLKRNWHDNSGQNRWIIQSPIDRGFVDPGPNKFIAHQAEETDVSIVPVAASSCAPIPVTATLYGAPVVGASLSLHHNFRTIDEGGTDKNGEALIYGAEAGNDTVDARLSVPGLQYTGSENISSCGAITVPLSISLAKPDQSDKTGQPNQSGQPNQPDRPDTQWPTHWLTATADFNQHQVHALLHFTTAPPAQPTLYASQGGTNRQQIALTYDPVGHNYTGDYPLNPNIALDFQFEVGLSGAQGVELFPYTFDAAQFHANGPGLSAPAVAGAGGKLPPMSPTPTPSMWDLFPPENMVSLSVSSTSLISGTGVMVGQVDSPVAPPSPPNGLLAAGGPYFIQGENPISGSIYVSFEYQSEYFCGLQAGSVRVYRYRGTGWDPLPTSLNEEWHLAATTTNRWGIYAVFAQPNPQAVFSDVPAGSTFYNYINWITCHGIASGYQDGTFRPNNNATRGQISKMVANAYKWHLDPPSTGGYTFADVLPSSTFFLYVEAAYREGVVSGYPCGGSGAPCDPQSRPYFRPNSKVTRGQLSKIISNGSKWDDTPTSQTFEDVPPGSTFYAYIERMAGRGIINGYRCGGAGEPCNPPNNRPYFRPGNNATRGQLSKMIYLALQPR